MSLISPLGNNLKQRGCSKEASTRSFSLHSLFSSSRSFTSPSNGDNRITTKRGSKRSSQMAENDGASTATAPPRSTIALPPHVSLSSLFVGGAGAAASPGPMTLVSNFFSEHDPDSECRSFSHLLAGAMASPNANSSWRPSFGRENWTEDFSKQMNSGGGDGRDSRVKPHRPLSLVVAQSPMFTIPPGLSPASLLDSPAQGSFVMSHQQAPADVPAHAVQPPSHMHHIQAEYPSLSAAPASSLAHQSFTTDAKTHSQMPYLTRNPQSAMLESSEASQSDHRSPTPSLTVDKPADDGYNWRKYGQKQVKGSEYPRSYYKCTHPNCPVKKKIERSLDGHIIEIIYKGQHNHQPPQPNKCVNNGNGERNFQGNPELGQVQAGNSKGSNETIPAHSVSERDQESGQASPEQLSGSSDGEQMGDAETRVNERDVDEPNPKRRNADVSISELVASHRTVTEPRIIVQTTSEIDLLDDGYRWRKYGQKVVKGNPNPRSYYKCTNAGCNVRKHVERASTDPKAVITTYEGKHNHDVPTAKNNSHNTVNGNAPLLKPNGVVAENDTLLRRLGFGSTNEQPIALLRLKEEKVK